MATEVKNQKKDECSCGHPTNKKAADAYHQAERERRITRVEDDSRRHRERYIDEQLEQLHRKSHRHWWK